MLRHSSAPGARASGVLGASLVVAAFTLSAQLALFRPAVTTASDDYTAYVSNATALASGRPYGMPGYIVNPNFDRADSGPAIYPPGYPLVLAPMVAVVADPVRGAGLLNCFIYAALAGLLVAFAAPIAGLAGAVGVGLVAAANPLFLNQGMLLAPSEPLFMLLLVASFLVERLMRHEGGARSRPWAVPLMAATIALAGLTRLPGVLLAPALLAADLVRRRRLAWPPALAAILAGVLFLAVMAGFAWSYLSLVITLQLGGGPAVAGPGRLATVLENLAAMPGALSSMWTYRGGNLVGEALPGWALLLGKAVSLALLGLAGIGFAVQLRRPAMAELFAVMQAALLLTVTAFFASPRYWLPVSMLVMVYASAGGRVLGGLVRRPGLGAGAAALLMLGQALPQAAATLTLRDPFPPDAPAARAMFAHIGEALPPDAVVLGRKPRTNAFYGHRGAADPHLAPSDPGFSDWARSIGATHLLLFVDDPAVSAATRRQGKPVAEAARLALDEHQAAYLGAASPRFRQVFDTGNYRLFQIVPATAP